MTRDQIIQAIDVARKNFLSTGRERPTGAWLGDAADAILALPAQEWQDISTAPKDGDQVLLWSEAWEMSWGVQIGTFGDGKWHCGEGSVAEGEIEFDDDDPYPVGPTHWMPLPPAPLIAEERATSHPDAISEEKK